LTKVAPPGFTLTVIAEALEAAGLSESFDIPYGQTGVAPNAIELHPVLRTGNSTCAGGSPPLDPTRPVSSA
jgi:hypothetical protein